MHNHTIQIQSTSNKDVAALCPAPEGLGLATDLLPLPGWHLGAGWSCLLRRQGTGQVQVASLAVGGGITLTVVCSHRQPYVIRVQLKDCYEVSITSIELRNN
jgi:hypothetical protein